jgi:geranylgeranyl diphosphate synthase type II
MLNDMLGKYADLVENYAIKNLPESDLSVAKAMKYSLVGGGKRIRPALLLEFYRICGGDIVDALPFACAVEMIHTYSLIHDDLPCMDDDDIRRGKPSCHVAFGEDIALLAGDALLTHAFDIATRTDIDKIPAYRIIKSVNLLAAAAGVGGMIGGQVLDLEAENKQIDIEELYKIHYGKTVALLTVPAQIALTLAGADNEKMKAAEEYSRNIGLAFQIRDDILDVIGDEALLGKPIGSDSENQKNTYVSLLGLEKANEKVLSLTDSAVKAIEIFGSEAAVLQELARYMAIRNK